MQSPVNAQAVSGQTKHKREKNCGCRFCRVKLYRRVNYTPRAGLTLPPPLKKLVYLAAKFREITKSRAFNSLARTHGLVAGREGLSWKGEMQGRKLRREGLIRLSADLRYIRKYHSRFFHHKPDEREEKPQTLFFQRLLESREMREEESKKENVLLKAQNQQIFFVLPLPDSISRKRLGMEGAVA